MGKLPKPYESPLSLKLAEEILVLFQVSTGSDQVPRTIKDLVSLIDQTNERLRTSQVAKLVATSIMQSLKKRGEASLVIRYDGSVVMRVTYGEEEEVEQAPRSRRDAPSVQITHKSDLPYLDELRAEAAELGVDITHLGRQRRAIHEFLVAYTQNVKPQVDEVTIIRVEGKTPTIPRNNGVGKPVDEAESEFDPLDGFPEG